MGLRVAFAVSVGFTSAVSLGAIVPFLVPIFAAQFLLGSSGPMPLGKTLGAALLILFTGIGMMVLTNLFGDRPSTFLILLALIYFFCFAAQSAGTGGPAIFLVQVVAIMVPLIGILNKDLANSILSILISGILGGTLVDGFWGSLYKDWTVTAQLNTGSGLPVSDGSVQLHGPRR